MVSEGAWLEGAGLRQGATQVSEKAWVWIQAAGEEGPVLPNLTTQSFLAWDQGEERLCGRNPVELWVG